MLLSNVLAEGKRERGNVKVRGERGGEDSVFPKGGPYRQMGVPREGRKGMGDLP